MAFAPRKPASTIQPVLPEESPFRIVHRPFGVDRHPLDVLSGGPGLFKTRLNTSRRRIDVLNQRVVSRLGVVASLALAPSQLPAMIGIANDARRAFVALFRCHRFLSPGFGFFDLC